MSLRARVTLGFTAVLAVALAAAGTFLYVRFAADLQRTQDGGLRARAAQLAAAAARPDPPRGRLPGVPGVEADEDVAQLVAADGAVLAGSPLAARAPSSPPPRCGRRPAARSSPTAPATQRSTSASGCSPSRSRTDGRSPSSARPPTRSRSRARRC